MEIHRIALQAMAVYLFLLALLRLSGKRTVAEGTPFSLVLALILGDMVDDAIWGEASLARFAAGAGTLAVTHLLVSWGSRHSERFDGLVSGAPTLVLESGRPQRRGLRGERMNEKSLAFEIRQEGIDESRWPEIRTVHIEASGAPSLVMEDWARPVPKRDADAVRSARKRA